MVNVTFKGPYYICGKMFLTYKEPYYNLHWKKFSHLRVRHLPRKWRLLTLLYMILVVYLGYNLIFFMFIRFPAILLVKTTDSYLHEFCAQGILHSDFQLHGATSKSML